MNDRPGNPAPVPQPEAGVPRRRRGIAIAVFAMVVVMGIAAAVWSMGFVPCDTIQHQPACNVALLPGPTEAVDDLVEVDAPETFGSEGELLLTTIVVDSRLTVVEYVRDLLDDDASVVDRETIYPSGQTVQDARIENEILMSDSQLTAKVAALDHLGVDLEALTAGAEVVTVLPDTPAETSELTPGDVVTAVDGEAVGNADEAVAAIGVLAPGDVVTLTLGEGDDATDVDVELAENPEDADRPYVGVLLRDYQVLPYDIEIEAGAIGGPSAGLVFSLGIVDRLTEEDLTGGDVVAGTGTINDRGQVGPIGGIVQKVAGAVDHDDPAEVFLVPDGNWESALTATPSRDITLVRVATLDDAVLALEELSAGGTPAGAVVVGPDGHGAVAG
ncbi:MAG TPA: PDZ domain-containing protein [Nitriliruptoraceae bacterium]|nr:PDZ domain-containing protein [Nitriliruptoraceae bacterium]